ncbi:MAG: signal peptidase I [Oscillospiraceae bacterium]|nr:signal peptidase I [Oscillospiraceae bacterium]
MTDNEKVNNNLEESSEQMQTDDIIEDKEEKKEKDYIVVNNSPSVGVVYYLAHSVIIAVVVIIILLTFFFRIVNVDGRSMMNTLLDGDKVIVTNFMYEPKNNDIVVISHAEEYDKPIIKRVIATEGQTLKIDFQNERVYVDGTLIDEPYVSSELKEGNTEIPEVIPEGKVFVMGDNRLDSLDSRYSEIGLIDTDNIIGKAQFVALPITRIQYLY